MQPNHVKEVLKTGGCAVGTMIHRFVYADVGALVKRAGVDFVLIDTEHAPLGMESASLLCISTRAAGVVPIVRVPDSQYHLIARRLDAGALGIMMPRVRTRAEVELIVESAKYPPLGGRGCGIRPVMLDFESTGTLSGDMDWINENTLICIQIETREAMENLEEILSVPGVDATIMGPQDLSIALGTPGNHRSRAMELAVDRMIEVCDKYGVAPGIHIRNTELLLDMKRRGMRLLACGFDEGFMLEAMSQTMNLLRGGEGAKARETTV